MVVGGLGSDLELAGRLLRRMPGCDQSQDLNLARRQTRQTFGHVSAGGLTGAGEDRLDGIRAELSFPDGGAEFRGRSRIAQSGPMGPRFPGCLGGFGGSKDAGGGRKVGGLGVTMIAAAVETLMMAQDQRRDGLAFSAQ